MWEGVWCLKNSKAHKSGRPRGSRGASITSLEAWCGSPRSRPFTSTTLPVVAGRSSVVKAHNGLIVAVNFAREKLEVLGGNVLVGSPGAGVILRSPDGNTCGMPALDNAGALTVSPVACP